MNLLLTMVDTDRECLFCRRLNFKAALQDAKHFKTALQDVKHIRLPGCCKFFTKSPGRGLIDFKHSRGGRIGEGGL